MLYYLSNLSDFFGPLRLFRYVTFRAGCAAATAFIIVLLLGPLTIRLLKKFNTTAAPRFDGLIPEQYIDRKKDKTPSMGGILIVIGIVIATILWSIPTNSLMHIFILITVSLAAIGFIDDYSKAVYKKRDGISGKMKLFLQFFIAGAAVLYLFSIPENSYYLQQLMVPFWKTPLVSGFYGGLITFPLGVLVGVGSSNAVNLTDGKDGLAVGCIIFCSIAFAVFCYISGHKVFADHLMIHFIPGAGEVGIFASAIVGAGLGFLWWNCNPAGMFMGDTGSLALGGSIGLIAVLVRKELVLPIVGGVFVMEALSVIIQVVCFKLFKKRVFLCAPIHHHFERKGWTETQIVVRFWIIAVVLALVGLSTLKLR